MITAVLLIVMFFGLIAAVLGIVYAMLGKKWRLVRRMATISLVAVVIYFGALFGVSMASFQKEVKLREEFCIDEICFSAMDVQTAKTIGSADNQSTAQGMYYIVRVRGRSDAKRATQKFQPGSVEVVVVDDRGRRFVFSPQGQKALDADENSPALQF